MHDLVNQTQNLITLLRSIDYYPESKSIGEISKSQLLQNHLCQLEALLIKISRSKEKLFQSRKNPRVKPTYIPTYNQKENKT